MAVTLHCLNCHTTTVIYQLGHGLVGAVCIKFCSLQMGNNVPGWEREGKGGRGGRVGEEGRGGRMGEGGCMGTVTVSAGTVRSLPI